MLAVFAQDFSQNAAVAASGSSPHIFRSLVEKSLVQPTSEGYRLLEPVKQFASGRLDSANGWCSQRHPGTPSMSLVTLKRWLGSSLLDREDPG